MHRHVSVLLVCLIALSGCASFSEPGWLQELRAREAEPLPLQRIQSADHFFRTQVPAKLAGPVQAQEGAYAFSLDAGTVAPVDCWVYRDGIDFAASLSGLSESTFGAISQHLGEVQARAVDAVDAGVIEGSPFLAIDWIYRIQTPGGPQVGQVKHLVASKGGRGLYCQHNELGYAQTFRRVVGGILASLEYRKPGRPEPYFSEVSTLSIRGMRVGVEHTTLTRDGARDTRIETRTSLLVPVTNDTLQGSDTFAIEFAHPDGALINQVHVESANGELVSHLELIPQAAGAWSVEGTFQGKPLSTRIQSSRAPVSWLGEALALRETLAQRGAGAELTTTRWVPDADPTRLLDGTLTVERQLGPEQFAAKLVTAGLEADLVVDRRGTIASGSMDMGAAAVDFERVYTGGAF
jgi:hypothetical protein